MDVIRNPDESGTDPHGLADLTPESLSAEFDALFEQMQDPEWGRITDAGFRASPQELGAAAVAAVTRAGKRIPPRSSRQPAEPSN